MKKIKKELAKTTQKVDSDFFEKLWEKSWTYIKTVVDIVREPVLILDKDLRVMAANEAFYETFDVLPKNTEKKVVFDLGNGQWDITVLRKLLKNILAKESFFKGFQVAHDFPSIGRKVMILNARQIYLNDEEDSAKTCPKIILLAMEDVTEMMVVAESLSTHAKKIEEKLTLRTQRMEIHIEKLEKALNKLKHTT
jgi:nitrogen-specific signal transduction histidine kinase